MSSPQNKAESEYAPFDLTKGSQGQTERAIVLQEEEEDLTSHENILLT